jgi:hypothetical protein
MSSKNASKAARKANAARQARFNRPDLPAKATCYPLSCPECGKHCYRSRKKARLAASQLLGRSGQRAYQCGDWWHLTSADADSAASFRRTAR